MILILTAGSNIYYGITRFQTTPLHHYLFNLLRLSLLCFVSVVSCFMNNWQYAIDVHRIDNNCCTFFTLISKV